MKVSQLTPGGAPLLGEPPAIELGNTTYAVRGRLREGLGTVEHLAAWLRDVRTRLAVPLSDADLRDVTADDLALTRELRDTVRALTEAVLQGRRPAPGLVDTLNRHARSSPRWSELRLSPEPHVEVCGTDRPVRTALAALAEEAVALFGGPAAADLRRCHGPGCVLRFVNSGTRREFCSPGCGNRARAARHYARTRSSV